MGFLCPREHPSANNPGELDHQCPSSLILPTWKHTQSQVSPRGASQHSSIRHPGRRVCRGEQLLPSLLSLLTSSWVSRNHFPHNLLELKIFSLGSVSRRTQAGGTLNNSSHFHEHSFHPLPLMFLGFHPMPLAFLAGMYAVCLR